MESRLDISIFRKVVDYGVEHVITIQLQTTR